MTSAHVGNFISAVPSRPGFDVYCMNPQLTSTAPNIVIFTKSAGSNSIEGKLTFLADYGFRDSKIAANRREFGANSQQASVFYQGYDGNLLEYRISREGARALVYVDNVPARNVIAPAMGTSLATTISGEDNQTVFLFYQAEDNRICSFTHFVLDPEIIAHHSSDYVSQRAFGQWSLPSLVTSQPTESATTLSAFSWTESDPNALSVVDCVCVAFNQSPGRFMVHMRRELRRPASSIPSSLRPNFEPVVHYIGPSIRGPFSGAYVGAPMDDTGGDCSSLGQYKFYTQLLEDPSRIWEGCASSQTDGVFHYSVVVSGTEKLRTPARGTSITTIYDLPQKDDKLEDGSLTVIYTSPEGLLAFNNVGLGSPVLPSLSRSPTIPTTPAPGPTAISKLGYIVNGVYMIINTNSLALQMDEDFSLSATEPKNDNLFHMWLVEAVDGAYNMYTFQNIATGIHMQVDDGLSQIVNLQVQGDGQRVQQWNLISLMGTGMFKIQNRAEQTLLESVSDKSNEVRLVPLQRALGDPRRHPSGPSALWDLRPVSVEPVAVQKAADAIPNVAAGWSNNRSYRADNHYILLPPGRWQAIWKESGMENYQRREEVFDYDDFAVVFKGKVAEWGYNNIKTLKVGILCGLVCARTRHQDAGDYCFNFNLSENRKVITFFEPQAGIFKTDLIAEYEPTFGFW